MTPMAEIAAKVGKLYIDMYVGEGAKNPSITTRMTVLEQGLDRIDRNLSKMTWLLVGSLLTTLGEFALRLFWK